MSRSLAESNEFCCLLIAYILRGLAAVCYRSSGLALTNLQSSTDRAVITLMSEVRIDIDG
jgi:hypothetical protein